MKKITNLIRIFAMMVVLMGASSSAFGAYYMKHPWGGNGWEWKQLDGNNKVTAAYGGGGVNVHTSANDNGAQWFGSPTLVGSPTKGTQCVFEYNPSSNTVTITAVGGGTTTSSLYIIGDAVKGWNDASKIPIFVAMTAGTSGEYYYDGLYADREFKFTSQNNWSDASQTIFNDASADNTKSVGATASKVKNGNDTNAKVSLEEGYVEPIKFFVNTSTKKFWAVATKGVNFDLTASKTDYDTASAPEELTLKVTFDETTTGDFIWYKSADGINYTEIAGVTGDTYTLTGDDVPMFDTYFKVKREKADTTTPAPEYLEDTVKISVFQTCGEGTKGSNLFKITFDDDTKLKTLLGPGSRMEFDAMVEGYVYAVAPQKIDDGEYAIVTEPLYCGYGTGGKEECGTDLGCIDERIRNNPNDRWYRGFRDHTQNKGGANPPFGGMLLINFKKPGVAFSRILTPDETKDFSEGAVLTFSAYMASAAVESKPNVTFKPIDTELIIEFKKTGETTWKPVANIESQVEFKDNWKRFETSWKITDIEGEFRVVIKNNGSTGDGNDLLIDDISLDLCSPTISVEFSDIQADSYTFTSVDEEISVRVPKVNFGSISDPCLMLFGIDKNGKYNFIAEMLDDNGNYYVAKNSVNGSMLIEIADDGSRNIAPMQLQAVVSEKIGGTCNDDVMSGVQDGTYTPGADPMVVFSSNTLSVDLTCQESQLILIEGEPTSICYSEDMIFPELKLTSNNISSSVSLDILVNDDVVLQGVPFVPEQGTNVMVLNVSELYLQATGNPYLPSQGVQKVTVNITESFAGGILCERFATGEVSIEVVDHSDAPIGNRPGEHYSYNMCKTEITKDGEETDPDVIDNKYFFVDLILEGEDKEGLVWLDKDGNIIPEENAFFYADQVQDESVSVYRDPAGGCPSDTTTIYYRVKEITRTPVVNNYLDCAKEGDPIALSSRVEGADTYKYLLFINGTDTLATFDPSVPGSKTYEVVASYDEINSASNNYCEATTELTVKVKDYAKKINILAQDTAVCSIDSLILLADTEFATPQTNVTINWYSDKDYLRKLGIGKTFSYFLVADPNTQYPYTLYLTVQSDDYCENIPSEAKPVTITLKEQAPSLLIEPKEQTISVGGVPSFTLSPAGEQRYSLYVNDKKVEKGIEEFKPYIDSEYKVVYEGECGSSYDSARVEVQWPTVFTPHVKDGRNDTFVKDMDPNFYTKIFTRYGTKIYESPNGWDGSVGGSMNGSGDVAVPGVYYYVVDLPDGNVKKGTIEVFKY